MSFQLLDPEKGIFLSEAGSTNTILKGKEFPPGSWILADFQSSGRGRKGKTWSILGEEPFIFSGKFSSDSNLSSPGLFSLYVGVAVAKAILSVYPSASKKDLRIKWPNDIYLNGKKVCGILIETEKEGEVWDWILGIGANLYGIEIPDYLTDAGFITDDQNEKGRRAKFLETLLPLLNDAVLAISDGDKRIEFINEKLLWKGETIAWTESGEQKTAILLGVNEEGKLLARTSVGNMVEFIDSPEDFRSLG
ncbi:biotin--[acetyl-CoA-carboxylase] ligase [Leptospira koniambonensis]|uniref:Biotin--[acetyl-CoA-carboxylase] ligase n=1 Tax=Leptospira koniambonensis TaxID=2484950 RepID=A0A4V3JN81_9LEPT|nr:biotin--[acetyl-CoA-carboxylase] ligase [Leptospira koniambonensis]TGL33859.1 biotin--[acetyl-CoA-carboxylase] ligase [Leptospira koniambonensis]